MRPELLKNLNQGDAFEFKGAQCIAIGKIRECKEFGSPEMIMCLNVFSRDIIHLDTDTIVAPLGEYYLVQNHRFLAYVEMHPENREIKKLQFIY